LAALDAGALIAFVLVGIRSHHDADGIRTFARNAVPLLTAWFVVGSAVGTYRRPGLRSLALTWVVAVPIGLLVRSIWVGSPTRARLLLFLAVGLAFTLLFLLAGRGVARAMARMGTPGGAPNVLR
jgi:hypothetical protein